MPTFHTKTIAGILEPVAQQVSRLVILHEEAEDGNAMPDLERPVQGVSKAVTNLVNVGRETINSSDDPILKQDMPASLQRVERASHLLEDASAMLKSDPFSQPARKKLIEGSRGILQGTSLLLTCFDESEVRKIIKECKKVLDYLAVAEVIDNMEDLVQFVKDLSPCLTKVSRDVDYREKELTHQIHREILSRSLESIKTLAPVLICAMKIYVQLIAQGKTVNEAAENRNYLIHRMTDEINEIIRVLQLTTYDEDEWEADDITRLKKAYNAILGKLATAHDWLEDPSAVTGGVGEKSVRSIIENARRISNIVLPEDRDPIRKSANDIESMTNALCELRDDGKSGTPQAQSLGRSINNQLKNLSNLVNRAIQNLERSGIQGPAHTISGQVDQASKWLSNLNFDDKGIGSQAIKAIVSDGRKIGNLCNPAQKEDIYALCNQVEMLQKQLEDLCHRGLGHTPQAQELARKLKIKLRELNKMIEKALITRVVEDFIDIHTPLRQFVEAVHAPEGVTNRENNFLDKANNLSQFSQRVARTARNVGSGLAKNKRLAEGLINYSNQIESLTPQLISAGRIRLAHPNNKSADEHFDNLRAQYQDNLEKLQSMVDEAVDSVSFINASEDAILKYSALCENAIANQQPQSMVENTSNIARLSNRVLGVAKQEAENSEDFNFINNVNRSADNLQRSITSMIQDAKNVAINMSDPTAISKWRESNKHLINCVAEVKNALTPDIPDQMSQLSIDDEQFNKFDENIRSNRPISDDEFKNIFANLDGFIPDSQSAPEVPPLPKMVPVQAAAPPPSSTSTYQNYANYNQPRSDAYTPPRPPPPSMNNIAPLRPPPVAEYDDEYDDRFPTLQPNQPIMLAAHDLHQEVRQWSSKENEIIAAAKKMAIHMARLSTLCGGQGTKKDLIACAKQIAEMSDEVTRLAKDQAKLCTDKRMRTNILQVCERIPTIGTQLRILSTVKATLLGAQGSQEDQEATEMLVGNAQNLMQSVKETVRACEAASIKIRTDSGVRMVWVRKQPWYQ
ncbi:Vinculin [Sarcoptes scabiei]|nr:Vinculin [Sarcoptes scabiei]UXI17913.1 fibronectin type-III domain-containing protein 3A [Sarcoptes scabiei]